MPTVKSKQLKKVDSAKIEDSVTDIEKEVIAPKSRARPPIELDEVEEPLLQDDKLPGDPSAETSEVDTEVEEVGLDDDELDPFHDKWEQ